MRAADYLAAIAALPMLPLRNIVGDGPVLVLAPHPDDESLGCGGLIAAASAAGIPLRMVFLTDGTRSHPDSPSYPSSRLRDLREQEARAAAMLLGVTEAPIFLRQPDAEVPHSGPGFGRIATDIADLIVAHRAATLLTTWRFDPHCDHEAASLLAVAACATTGAKHLAFPVWGWTLSADTVIDGPAPSGARLDIANHLPAKRRAVAAHISQTTDLISDSPHGFRLPDDFLTYFDRPWEAYIEP